MSFLNEPVFDLGEEVDLLESEALITHSPEEKDKVILEGLKKLTGFSNIEQLSNFESIKKFLIRFFAKEDNCAHKFKLKQVSFKKLYELYEKNKVLLVFVYDYVNSTIGIKIVTDAGKNEELDGNGEYKPAGVYIAFHNPISYIDRLLLRVEILDEVYLPDLVFFCIT